MSRMYSTEYCSSRDLNQQLDNHERKRALSCEAVNLGCLSQQFPGLDADGKTFHRLSIAKIRISVYAMTRPLFVG